MGTQAETTETVRTETTGSGPGAPAGGRWWDIGAVVAYVLAGFYVTARLWVHLPDRTLGSNPSDQSLFEWMLAHGAYFVAHGGNPLFSDRLNVPDGVNLMANTSVLGVSVPLAPVTWLFGPHVTFAVLLVLGFAGAATGWYFLLSRRLVRSRSAAFLGAAFCAFAPGMISQSNAHLHMSVSFLVPLIVWRTLALTDADSVRRSVRSGVVLGLLIAWEAFIGEETLLLTALGVGSFTVLIAILRPDLRRRWKPFVTGLGVAGVLAVALLAYPLWFQFFGPQAYHGLRPDIQEYGADLGAFPAFARESLAGTAAGVRGLASGPTEENAFFGWPLLILFVALVAWLRRNRTVIALAVVAVVAALCALGPWVLWHGRAILPGPWMLMRHVPLFDSIVPTRFALVVVPAIGIVLAIAWDRWRSTAALAPRSVTQWAIPIFIVAALVPVAPTPLPTAARHPAPELIASGQLAKLVPADRSALILPPSRSGIPDAQQWAAAAGLSFRITHGYFLGPSGDPAKRWGIFTSPPRPTSTLINSVYSTGVVPPITPAMRTQAVTDLRFWRAAVIVLPKANHEDALKQATTELVGFSPKRVGDTWLWDVRTLAS
ncbi:hypothetical protein [Fodinicola acaciae]|uniref:hypothetical protein n=1 Tax=Fodinicola acaciae TaxID=2681555 RepID=UPI0013D1659B|nr:hypothetical protein [Fodinicola acaciae]